MTLSPREQLKSDLDSLYRSKYRDQYKYIRSKVKSKEDTEDIIQTAYMRALKYSSSYRGGDVAPWFLTILRNVLYDHMNGKSIDSDSDERWLLSVDKENQDLLSREIEGEESKEDRFILTQYFIFGATSKDIANSLSLSASAVRSIAFRFREKLKEKYDEGGGV